MDEVTVPPATVVENEGIENNTLPAAFNRIITSWAMFVTAYIVTNMFHQLVLGLLCIRRGYTTKIGFHHVSASPFTIDKWTSGGVLTIYGTPPVICAILGVTVFLASLRHIKIGKRIHLFYFWLFACFTAIFLTHLFITPMGTAPTYDTGLYQTFAIITTWYHVPTLLLILATVLAVALAIISGYLAAPVLYRFSYSHSMSKSSKGKNQMARQLYLIPGVLAAPLVLAFSNKHSFLLHVFMLIIFLFFWIGIVICNVRSTLKTRSNKADVLNKRPWKELAVAVAVTSLAVLFFNK